MGRGDRGGAQCECEQTRGKRRQVQPRTTGANDELITVDLEGSFGTLMAHQAAGRVYQRGRSRDRRNRRSNRQRRDEDRRDP